jgi:hypothetical protein
LEWLILNKVLRVLRVLRVLEVLRVLRVLEVLGCHLPDAVDDHPAAPGAVRREVRLVENTEQTAPQRHREDAQKTFSLCLSVSVAESLCARSAPEMRFPS